MSTNDFITKRMNPKRAILLYLAISAFIAVVTRPGYDTFSAAVILIGGTLGSLKLSIVSALDVQYETLDAGIKFSSEALTLALVAIIIWLIGGWFTFEVSKTKWKGKFLAGLVLMWLIGAGYNIFWFGVRSL